MVVALGAFQAGPQKDPHRVGHVVQRHPAVALVIPDGPVVPEVAPGADQFIDQLVVGLVLPQGVLDPETVGGFIGLAVVSQTVVHPQHISPIVVGVADTSLGGEEFLDQTLPFLRIGAAEKLPGLRHRGDPPDQVEIGPSDEGFIIDRSIHGHSMRFAGFGHQLIDPLGRGPDAVF